MRAVHALVAEVLAELVHAVESADDQLFEVELRGDAQVEVDIERVVVRDERTRRGAARNGLQDRGLDFDIAFRIEKFTHRGHDFGAADERIFDLRVDNQVEIPLAVAHLGIGEGVERPAVLLFDDGQRADRFRQHGETAAVHRQFAGVGEEREALDAHEVADVEQFFEDRVVERRIAFGADVVAADVDLNTARVVLQFEERGAAHDAARHDASGDAYLLEILFGVVVVVGDLARRGRHLVAGCGVGFDAQFTERRERLSAKLFLFAEFECHIVCF